jgi:S-adenosylmethionine/arginine decarboxylase-like enzyme
MRTVPTAPGPAAFAVTRAWGLSTSVDLYGCDPDAIRSAAAITRFAVELCDRLGVRRFGDPVVVRFGADPRVCGYSLVQLIETSLVSAHFAEESNAVYLDVFSCRWYDAEAAAAFARDYFQAESVRVHTCLRQ